MKKLAVCILLITLFTVACGKQAEDTGTLSQTTEAESDTESTTDESVEETGESSGFSEDYADLVTHVDGEDPLTDEELAELDDDYFEPENAENVEGMEEAARLSEEYGFCIVGLESVNELTYPDYEMVYDNVYGYLRSHKYPLEDVTILLQTVESNSQGVWFVIVPTDFDEDYDLRFSYQYGGYPNISQVTVSGQEPQWKKYYNK